MVGLGESLYGYADHHAITMVDHAITMVDDHHVAFIMSIIITRVLFHELDYCRLHRVTLWLGYSELDEIAVETPVSDSEQDGTLPISSQLRVSRGE